MRFSTTIALLPNRKAPAKGALRNRLKPLETVAEARAVIGKATILLTQAGIGHMLDGGRDVPMLAEAITEGSRFAERDIAAHGVVAGRHDVARLAIIHRAAELGIDED